MQNSKIDTEIIVIFKPNGFALDKQYVIHRECYNNEKLLADFSKNPYRTLFYFGFEERNDLMTQGLMFLHTLAAFFVEKQTRNPHIEVYSEALDLNDNDIETLLAKLPYAIGTEYIDATWIQNIWTKLSIAYSTELKSFNGTASKFLLNHNSKLNIASRIFFHLVENKSQEYPFAFLATYSRINSDGKAEHIALKNALTEFRGDQTHLIQLLASVSRAAEKSELISEILQSGELFSPLQFNIEEAYTFLKEIPLYEECGIMCRMPDWWKKKYNSVKIKVSVGETVPSTVGLDAILSFSPSLCIDGVQITRKELETLIKESEGLHFLKGKWVEVKHDMLQTVLDAFDKINDGKNGMTIAEALRLQMGLTASTDLEDDNKTIEVTNGTWLNNVLSTLKNGGIRQDVSPTTEFKATLRKYQQEGLNWLATMKSMGFGALLADDMGLGKTIQVLALLDVLRTQKLKTLLIIPASLIGNWQTEAKRFVPSLRCHVLHGQNACLDDTDINNADLFITTYGMATRLSEIKNIKWDLLILDEAQAIKNPATKQTRAIKEIKAHFKIAMTGTPIENKLTDLWSIFDFINNGLLGTQKEFLTFSKKIKETGSYLKLKNVISPFILRRLKTNKTIIADLPDKLETKTYSVLNKKQIALYTEFVSNLAEQLETLDGIQRKGIVLSSLMKLKQICNHPDQYLGQDVFDSKHSGKFEILAELIETIHEKREKVLIFTQFKEMCEPLSNYLSELFRRKGLVLHGGTPIKKRAELVEKFNSDEYIPYMVLSLKAGGVGLNLTAANHVIHFDRWWNPAVENQATDRAFRIGQTKNVLVHKLITSKTIEEKIDDMIENKLKLSGELIQSSGESWITELDNKQLINLFKLEV